MTAGLPPAVSRFIRRHIGSVVKLELLLLLRDGSARAWTAADASAAFRSDHTLVQRLLQELASDGLAAAEGDAFRYQPEAPALARDVDELAASYAGRRHAVIAEIYAAPDNTLRSFSDAFRLRGDP